MIQRYFIFFTVILMHISQSGCEKKDKNYLLVGTAMSLKGPMEEISSEFEKKHNIKLRLNLASSGVLATQIRAGAPLDIYLSASSKFMDHMVDTGFIVPDSRIDFLSNTLVLVAPKSSSVPVSLKDIIRLKSISIGNTSTVPAGIYAKKVLMEMGIFKDLKSKIVYGQHVRQVASYVIRGEVEAAILFYSDFVTFRNKLRLVEKISPEKVNITYSAGIIINSVASKRAQVLLKFLESDFSKNVFKKYGFIPRSNK
ncbi:MAG: molybdate ABC transporter substrate-binding protein [Deltaproteobacteria bacterium]|nr:molybdate ABC transporter substrate-binding protein [Deltaproteobacteria bacterium]